MAWRGTRSSIVMDTEEPTPIEEAGAVEAPMGVQETVQQPIRETQTTPRQRLKTGQRTTKTVAERMLLNPVNERFAMVDTISRAVCYGDATSMIIQGRPGIGKSFGLMKVLKELGFVEGENLFIVKGNITAFVFYQRLCDLQQVIENRKAEAKEKGKSGPTNAKSIRPIVPMIIFDDVPFWEDKKMMDLLKAATDTLNPRKVSWQSGRMEKDAETAKSKGGYPPDINFTGGLVVLTNVEEKKMNKALKDRSFYCPIPVTENEMIERMIHLAPNMGPEGMNVGLKKEVAHFVTDPTSFHGEEVSLRTLEKALRLANTNPKTWKRLVYTLA
jgi:hypothetical protein